jgi:hypothetical protein
VEREDMNEYYEAFSSTADEIQRKTSTASHARYSGGQEAGEMKIIYDSDQPQEKRLTFIGNDKKPYYGFRCFQIQLDDGKEVVTIGLWGNEKKRRAILERLNRGNKK